MQHVRLDTQGEHPRDRAARWHQINREYFGELEVDSLSDAPMDADLSMFSVGALRMYRINGPAHRVRRSARCAELPGDELYKLVLQLDGNADIVQPGGGVHLQRGEWSLYDPRVPYAITNHARAALLVVQIPRPLLHGLKVPRLHSCHARSSGVIGLHAVLGSFLQSLSEQLVSLDDGVAQPLSETVVGLLASTLAASQDLPSPHATLPGVLKARVKQYVHTHLGDPDLGIERIARDMHCSKRYLHRVFEDEDISLDRYIWHSRLQRCHAALGAPAAQPRSISEIAYGWGFNSSAHFCRMFKSHFGIAPRDYQRQAAQRASAAAPAQAGTLSH